MEDWALGRDTRRLTKSSKSVSCQLSTKIKRDILTVQNRFAIVCVVTEDSARIAGARQHLCLLHRSSRLSVAYTA